jgi:RNA polymerase sigma-70 factor (ECF subfamily)
MNDSERGKKMSAVQALTTTSKPMLDPTIWLEQHGDYLYRYAMLRLRDSSAAEDMVQETLLAALKSSARFAGASSERTWLVGILKHKITDWFRRQHETTLDNTHDDDEFFGKDGFWKSEKRPIAWNANPELMVQSKDFQRVLTQCLNQLPDSLARVFILRELNELTTDEICELLDITPSNLWVMLHRARLRLQHLLGVYWFNEVATSSDAAVLTLGNSLTEQTA